MKPKDFHLSLIEIIDLIESFPKTFWTMLVAPSSGFLEALNAENKTKILPGVFLFLNLFIADLLSNISLYNDIREWLLQVLREIPSHIIGTLIFLFILKRSFRNVKTGKLLTIICLSSIVYIPFIVVVLATSFIVGPSFVDFWTFALSNRYQTTTELLAPLISISYKLIPLLSVLTIALIWWIWLLSLGCGQIVAISTTKRFLKISRSILAYVIILIAAITIVAGATTFSVIRGFVDYEKMRLSFETGDYAKAFILASSVSNNEKLPPVARYRACVIRAVSEVKTFWKNDDTFRDAILAINAKKYRDAEIMMRKEVEKRLLSLDSPMRFSFKNAETSLDDASKQFNSPGYSEAPTQINILVLFGDIPINLFPSF